MSKLKELEPSPRKQMAWQCPGCKRLHAVLVDGAHAWHWNGDLENPTISPSVMCNRDEPERRCHSFISNGQVQFLDDCYHELAGKTVEMKDWEE